MTAIRGVAALCRDPQISDDDDESGEEGASRSRFEPCLLFHFLASKSTQSVCKRPVIRKAALPPLLGSRTMKLPE